MRAVEPASDNNCTRCRSWIALLVMAFALTCHVANSPRFRSWVASLAIAFALTGPAVASDEKPITDKGVAAKSDRTALIDITIETSRSQPSAGDGLGVTADIKNVSDSVIHIEGNQIILVVPPELEGPGKWSIGWYAMLPTEGYWDETTRPAIDLKPGDSYRVFWTFGVKLGTEPEKSYFARINDVIASQMMFVFFPPGDYKIAVVCKYSLVTEPKPDPKSADYRTSTQTATIRVVAPQFVILFGAALGGLLAYFILPQARTKLVQTASVGRTPVERFINLVLKEAAGIAGAVLLSTMITILLSRISETQFLIRVTITDIWGAIAIGFVANYVGAEALNKILRRNDSTSATSVAAANNAAAQVRKGESKAPPEENDFHDSTVTTEASGEKGVS